jgi:hypothetical protein
MFESQNGLLALSELAPRWQDVLNISKIFKLLKTKINFNL